MSDPLAALTAQIGATGARAWLVGGAVRDQLMGRPTPDYDLAVEGDAKPLAKAVGAAAGGFAFQLSDEFGSWRVKAHDGAWQLDITPLQGADLAEDLGARDLTINAVARALTGGPQSAPVDVNDSAGLIDPYGGIDDIADKRLRAVSESSFSRDPLRVMRLGRFAAGFGFSAEPHTTELALQAAPGLTEVAAERVFQELRQTLCSDRAVAALRYLGEIGASAAVLPELDALKAVEQSQYHHLDVYDHTLMALQLTIDIEADPGRFFPDHAGPLSAYLQRPLTNEMSRGEALRFAALLHDIAKPDTREVTAEQRITFFDHDVRGAELSAQILRRLRASEKLASYVAAMTRNHLRLGFLVHERPLSRAAVYKYLKSSGAVAVDVTVLSLADRYATLGKNHERAGELHHQLAQEMLGEALAYDANPPKPLLRGDQLVQALGIEPGPQLGELIADLTAATFSGELTDAQQTLDYARRWLER
jgi:poly(A) polymerase